MGLDITASSRLERVTCASVVAGGPSYFCEDETHVPSYAFEDFPASMAGLPILDKHDGVLRGPCFVRTAQTQSMRFRAGSYGGYNAWRSDLAGQFNPHFEEGLPFYELIWFADSEGTIGPSAAASLHTDFLFHADAYDPGLWTVNKELYAEWTEAFALAADGGLVDFH